MRSQHAAAAFSFTARTNAIIVAWRFN